MLREPKGWEAAPRQWATVGYSGAVESGRTICGALFGGAVFHGFLHGENESQVPEADNKIRQQAIGSVRELFTGFKERFGDTVCGELTGCDFSKKEDQERYFKDEIYKDKCFRYVEYVLADCVQQMKAAGK